jgi:hypothetical protein
LEAIEKVLQESTDSGSTEEESHDTENNMNSKSFQKSAQKSKSANSQKKKASPKDPKDSKKKGKETVVSFKLFLLIPHNNQLLDLGTRGQRTRQASL